MIVSEPQALARSQPRQRLGECLAKHLKVADPVRICRSRCDRSTGLLRDTSLQRLAAAFRSVAVDEVPRHDRAQPRSERTTCVIVPEQRSAPTVPLLETVEIGIQRIRCFLRATFVADDRQGRPDQKGAKSSEELDPGRLRSALAGKRQPEIYDVQRAEVSLDLGAGWRLRAEPG